MGRRRLLALTIAALVAALLIFGPVAWEGIRTPRGARWTGYFSGGADYYTYLAKIDWGARGNWTWENRFTGEPTQPVPVYLFYLGLGRLANLLGLDAIWAYHIARAVLVAGFLVLLWFFTRKASRHPALAFLLAVGASGPGLVFLLDQSSRWVGLLEVVELFTQGHIWLAVLTFPHYFLTLSGLVLAFWGYILWKEERLKGALLAGAMGGFLISISHPHVLAVPVLAVILAEGLERNRWAEGAAYTGFVVAGAAPYLALLSRYLKAEWLWQWRMQTAESGWNEVRWLYPFWPSILYGLAAPLAAAAGRKSRETRLLPWVAWAVVGWGLAFLRLPGSQEWMFGLSVPVAILAADYLGSLLGGVRRPWRSVIAVIAIFLLIWPAAVGFAAGWSIAARSGADRAYVPDGLVEGLEFVKAESSPEEVVLAPPKLSSLVPYWAGTRVYAGHFFETLDYRHKVEKVRRFYQGLMTEDEAAEFLDETKVSWVVEERYFKVDLHDRAWSARPLNFPLPGLEKRFENGVITVWERR